MLSLRVMENRPRLKYGSHYHAAILFQSVPALPFREQPSRCRTASLNWTVSRYRIDACFDRPYTGLLCGEEFLLAQRPLLSFQEAVPIRALSVRRPFLVGGPFGGSQRTG